ncbi:hypothetical protein [Falsiroseomonas ponticola]|uniref:hypothetical protein n=1 Tax=Falsiroseomonas ponticola TaxID=2786951 RepID=UPI0019321A29|nr:hypothetical protein [Roseomonas ponticola]
MLRILLLLPMLLLSAPAGAQRAAPDLSWVERDWSALDAQQRGRAVRRFGRDQERDARPDRPEMQARWDAMTPGQRRELMLGPARATREAGGTPPRAERLPRPPPAAPRPGLVAPPPAAPAAPQGALRPNLSRA